MDFWKKFKPGFTILAPMEGVTDIAFRQVVAKAARPDVFYTEFTNVNSYTSEKGRHNALERFRIEIDHDTLRTLAKKRRSIEMTFPASRPKDSYGFEFSSKCIELLARYEFSLEVV